MTEEYYNQLKPYKHDMEIWCTLRSNISNDKLRAIGAIHDKMFPNSKPINFGCYGCVNSMMHLVYNAFKAYENTLSK